MGLFKLLNQMDRCRYSSKVISLSDQGPIGDKLQSLGFQVKAVGMRPGVFNPLLFFKLVAWLQRDSPHLVQTWMYHGDLIGGLAAKLAGDIPVIWNIRHSTFGQGSKASTRWIRQISAWFSSWLPVKIVTNALNAKEIHANIGYEEKKMLVIPNGFDLETYRPNPDARSSILQELNLDTGASLIGLIARFHPQKDHHTFIQAAALLVAEYPQAHFILAGERVTLNNTQLAAWIEATNCQSHFHLLGLRDDIPKITAGLDIATSSASHGEAFPNIIGEAMACAVPCVVTDVGDSSHIVGETGLVVPVRSPLALCEAWIQILTLNPIERHRLGREARERIKTYFSLEKIAHQYGQLYMQVLDTENLQT